MNDNKEPKRKRVKRKKKKKGKQNIIRMKETSQ